MDGRDKQLLENLAGAHRRQVFLRGMFTGMVLGTCVGWVIWVVLCLATAAR